MTVLDKIFSAASTSDLRNPRMWLQDWAGGRRTKAGEDVGPNSALGLSAYYAAMRVISEDIGKLPLKVFRRQGRGKEPLPDHRIHELIHDRPNPEMEAMTFRETLTAWALGWGDGFAEIQFDSRAEPVALWPIHPSRVRILRGERQAVPEFSSGSRAERLIYQVSNLDSGDDTIVNFDQSDILHIHGLGNGVRGFSVARLAAEAIGGGLAVQNFGNSFFSEGLALSGLITTPHKMKDEQKKRLRDDWKESYGAGKAPGTVAVIDGDAKFQTIAIPPEQAQWIQSKQFTVEDMARWFRVPPHKIQHLLRSTFNNIASQNIEYVVDTLLPWATRWEQQVKAKLFDRQRERDLFAKHNFSSLLRGDPKSRGDFLFRMFRSGVFSPNDIRELEDFNPVEDGDNHYVERNMIRLEDAASGTVDESASRGAASGGGENTGERADLGAVVASLSPVLRDAAERVLQKEINAAARADKKDDGEFSRWLEDFYSRHWRFVMSSFSPACAVVLKAGCAQIDISSIIDHHIRTSKSLLVSARQNGGVSTAIADWNTDRAAKFAAAIRERILSDAVRSSV